MALKLRKDVFLVISDLRMPEEELRWGGELQKKLLQRDIPRMDGIEFEVEYQPLPMLYCGGDYYDIIPLQSGNCLVLLGDVAGHGLKAAFITTILKTIIYSEYIRDHQKEGISPADFLKWLNMRISKELSQFPDILITFIALVINPKSTISKGLTGKILLEETRRKSRLKDIIEAFRRKSVEGIFHDDITLIVLRIK